MHTRPPRPSVTWRLVAPGLVLIATVQFALVVGQYLNLGLPVRLSVSWAPQKSAPAMRAPVLSTLDQPEAQVHLTHIPSPDIQGEVEDMYKWYTDAKLRELTSCITRGDCPPNADKIAIFASWHCHWALYEGYNGGEGVWCKGMIRSLERQGFTVLHGGGNDWRYIHHLHRQLGDMVRVIVADKVEDGPKGTWEMYQKNWGRPNGIPAWKWFRMVYYPTGESGIVGKPWMITAEPRIPPDEDVAVQLSGSSAEDANGGPSWFVTGHEALAVKSAQGEADFTFLGYGLSPSPEDTLFVPWSQRPYRVYILAKQAHYFHNGHQRVYDLSFFTRAAAELASEFPGFEFVGGFEDNRSPEDVETWGPIPDVIRNFGIMDGPTFDKEYGKSRLLLGLGSPPLSPSPYRALARGVPFANPHVPNEDGEGWSFQQHESMMGVPEPYAYQVEAFNYTSFVDTIRKAMTSPIEPLRFERMRDSTADQRIYDWIMNDWRGLAEQILTDRLAGNESQDSDSVAVFDL